MAHTTTNDEIMIASGKTKFRITTNNTVVFYWADTYRNAEEFAMRMITSNFKAGKGIDAIAHITRIYNY